MKHTNMNDFVHRFFGKDLVTIWDDLNYPRESGLGAINIHETDQAYEIEMCVPGFTKEDLKIEVDDELLIISAKVEDQADPKQWNRKEFTKKSFVRSFTLPEDGNVDHIQARVEHGILALTMTKQVPVKKTKRVTIL